MKKLLTFLGLIISLIAFQNAYAYEPYSYAEILWVSGIEKSQVDTHNKCEGCPFEWPYITGISIDEIETNVDLEISPYDKNQVALGTKNGTDKLIYIKEYMSLWRIKGLVKGEKFSIYFVTSKDVPVRNRLIFLTILSTLFIGSILTFIIWIHRIKKRK